MLGAFVVRSDSSNLESLKRRSAFSNIILRVFLSSLRKIEQRSLIRGLGGLLMHGLADGGLSGELCWLTTILSGIIGNRDAWENNLLDLDVVSRLMLVWKESRNTLKLVADRTSLTAVSTPPSVSFPSLSGRTSNFCFTVCIKNSCSP